MLPTDPPRAQNFNFKLSNLKRSTGLRVFARVYAKFSPAPGADTPDALSAQLESALAHPEDAVLAVYFADKDLWCLHAGAAFAGGAFGAKAGDIVARARQRAVRYAEQTRRAMPGFDKIPGQTAKISTDALLDELISAVTAAP